MVADLWVWAVLAARAADCPDGPVPPATLGTLLDEAEAAFVDLEIPTFITLTDQVRSAVPCLAEAVAPPLVARIHRAEGLRLFGERSVDAVRAFAAARSLEPEFVFPSDTVPPGSPILDDYAAMDLEAREPETLPEPLSGVLLVDGRPSRERPQAWPALVQLVPADGGQPTLSVYLRHDDLRPEYPSQPLPAASPLEGVALATELGTPPVTQPAARPRVPLLVATGSSAVLSGVLYGAAWATRGVYLDPETPDTKLPRLRARTNGLTVASAASGAAVLGLGTALAVTW